MAEEQPKEKTVDSEYGYEDEEKKSFLTKMVDFIRNKEAKAFKGMKDVSA